MSSQEHPQSDAWAPGVVASATPEPPVPEPPVPEPPVPEPPVPEPPLPEPPLPEPALAEPPPPIDPVEPSDPMLAVLRRLENRLHGSERLLARQTNIATSLHAENQRLKAGELRRAQLPLVRDLIRVQDVLGRLLALGQQSTAADLQIARDSILDALARNGIEQMRGERGDPLDPRTHKVVAVEPAPDPAADHTIADVVRLGFAWEDGATIRSAEVRVFKHTAPAPEPPELPSSD